MSFTSMEGTEVREAKSKNRFLFDNVRGAYGTLEEM